MRKSLTALATAVLAITMLTSPVAAAEAESATAATSHEAGVININTADASQFALLPRIGPKAGERIVDYRKTNGAFKKTTDLMQVKGVGDKTFELLSPYLAVDGKTTLAAKQRGPRRAKSSRSPK